MHEADVFLTTFYVEGSDGIGFTCLFPAEKEESAQAPGIFCKLA
jgi:hypothetical protein